MLFWIAAALLTIGASLAVLLPLAGRGALPSAEPGHDLEVYRDQLGEIERETARGLIGPAEAEQARAEIARRMIRADRQKRRTGEAGWGRGARALCAASVLAVPLVSWGLYGWLGSPDLPSQPLSARLETNPADSTIEELVARAEAHLAANPSDGRGWDVLAPIYLRLGRFPEAVTAFSNAIRFEGSTAQRQTGLGEAIAGAAGGVVTAESRAAFERALTLQPDTPAASFYLATALAQEGRIEEAVVSWQGMLSNLPPDSPWRGAAEQAIAEGRRNSAVAATEAGPDRQDVEAAAGMSDSDRNAMIENMVASLDQKLRKNPHDLEGWFRLVRSYVVLGRTQEARDAVRRATEALGEKSEAAGKLAAFSGALGISAVD